MSALYWIWTIYTCGQLNKLFDQEYYATNVPHVYTVPNNAFNGAAGNCQPQPAVYDCNCLEFGNIEFPGYRRLLVQKRRPPLLFHPTPIPRHSPSSSLSCTFL